MTAHPGTRFVVLTAPRSGSTWFIEMLNSYADVTVYAELFLPRKKPREQRMMSWQTAEHLDSTLRAYPLFCEAKPNGPAIRPFSVAAYLNELYRGPGATGFKCMYANLLHYPELWIYFVLRRLHVVHLLRRNHLDVVISDRMRWANRTVHRVVGEPEPARQSIALDPAELIAEMRHSQRNINIARALLRACRLPHIEVAYEALVQDPRKFDDVCRFLAVNRERGELHSKLAKLAKLVQGRHSEIISNYDEVRNALSGTEFASLLD